VVFFDGGGDPRLQPLIFLQVPFADAWFGRVEAAGAIQGNDGTVSGQLGNVLLGAGRIWDLKAFGGVELLGAFVVPSATAEGEGDRVALQRSERLRGLSRWWLFAPDQPAWVVRVRHASVPGEGVRLQWQGAPALAWNTRRSEALFGLSGSVRASVRRGPAELGVAFEGVMRVNDRAGTVGQLSVEPDVRFRWPDLWGPGAGPYAELRLRINLDPPAGPSFDGGVYGLACRVGSRF
jgi:hypothetical protein